MPALTPTPKILIAEDDLASRELIAEILRGRGYEVLEAADGGVALELCQAYHPDLVIMDIQMPELDGFAVLARLRQLQLSGVPPVIAVTAHAMMGDRERALEAGFDEYLTKPVETTLLRQRVQDLLKGQ
jgi:CheY-like chemotaxis protein